MIEITSLAANLARNCGWRVLPCRDDKRPACPHGFKDAASDPESIGLLWRNFPGPLIGFVTGSASGVDVLDIDVKHDGALGWWRVHQHRIPQTRTYRTRSGGIHLIFQHAAGFGCSAGKVTPGVDVRADGGYAISWFSAGLPCLDHSRAAAWPAWMLALLSPSAQPEYRAKQLDRPGVRDGKAVDGVLRLVANAAEGQRNAILHWAACRLGEGVEAGQLDAAEAEDMLVAAAASVGLADREARATVLSGLRRTRR